MLDLPLSLLNLPHKSTGPALDLLPLTADQLPAEGQKGRGPALVLLAITADLLPAEGQRSSAGPLGSHC